MHRLADLRGAICSSPFGLSACIVFGKGAGRRLGLQFFVALVAASIVENEKRAAGWQSNAPLPQARTEGRGAGRRAARSSSSAGFLANGSTSARADAYSPARDRWRRLPDLPVAVNHAMAASDGRRVYVVGGYAGDMDAGNSVRDAWVLSSGRWQTLPAPAGEACRRWRSDRRRRLYVVGWRRSPWVSRARRSFSICPNANGRRRPGRRPASISPSPPPAGVSTRSGAGAPGST